MPQIIIITIFMVSSISFVNDENAAKDDRIHQTDSIGTIDSNKTLIDHSKRCANSARL